MENTKAERVPVILKSQRAVGEYLIAGMKVVRIPQEHEKLSSTGPNLLSPQAHRGRGDCPDIDVVRKQATLLPLLNLSLTGGRGRREKDRQTEGELEAECSTKCNVPS